MKINKVTLFVCLMFLFGLSYAQLGIIPNSARSRNAVARNIDRITQEMEDSKLNIGSPVYMRIFKDEQTLELWIQENDSFKLFKNFEICSFSGGLGTKLIQGDGKSPEGFYFVTPKRLNPYSSFHLSFNIGYPNRYERLKGYTGSALMVHGNCVSIGCYAMGDENIEEIWTIIDAALRMGQPYFRIHIFPFRMTEDNMERYNSTVYDKWQIFWHNLKEGYDIFENSKNPPNVNAINNDNKIVYVFN